MNKYVSPIMEIEAVEVEDILNVSLGENETGGTGGFNKPTIPTNPNPGDGDDGGDDGEVEYPMIPFTLYRYFNT